MILILVDTSFLISLADTTRPNHSIAKQYFLECLKRNIMMYLSAIVVSEFQVKQAITDLPLRNFQILPFNIVHAMTTGILTKSLSRSEGDDRVAVKDDTKLIAQTVCESITHVLTEDKRTPPSISTNCKSSRCATLLQLSCLKDSTLLG